VSAFIDKYRARFGVELICRTLEVSVSAYYQRATGERSERSLEDVRLTGKIRQVFAKNYECYGIRRMHAQLLREGETVGRDQVARLMRAAGIQGAKRRGKRWRTTISDLSAAKRPDLVNREFTATAPDQLWVGDRRLSAARTGTTGAPVVARNPASASVLADLGRTFASIARHRFVLASAQGDNSAATARSSRSRAEPSQPRLRGASRVRAGCGGARRRLRSRRTAAVRSRRGRRPCRAGRSRLLSRP
jgi:hypothetical protein